MIFQKLLKTTDDKVHHISVVDLAGEEANVSKEDDNSTKIRKDLEHIKRLIGENYRMEVRDCAIPRILFGCLSNAKINLVHEIEPA